MKNIALLSVAALVILLIGTLIHYENTSYDVIFTANVEALSDAEHGEYVKCWKSIRDDIFRCCALLWNLYRTPRNI